MLLGGIVFTNTSCNEYLNIVPEGIPSMDNAFSNRASTERFLVTCYSYLPTFSNPASVPDFLAGDECWLYPKGSNIADKVALNAWEIGRGSQTSNAPFLNYWDSGNGGHNLWIAIRDCNIFLENIHKPQDMDDYEKNRWIAEVKFLKAFYHFYLMQLYGAIPIMDVNIDVNAGIEAVRVYRDPFDDVVNYIVALIDECVGDLPVVMMTPATEMGRATQSIALAVKTQVLLLAASPLMNGNIDYAQVEDNRGTKLFSQEYDASKWQIAADAAIAAIESAHEAGHKLHIYEEFAEISETTRRIMTIKGAVSERWNEEIIWGCTGGTRKIQQLSMPRVSSTRDHFEVMSCLAPTLKIVEQFYSNNGVPLDEDKNTFWKENYNQKYDIVTIPDEGENKYLLEIGQPTINLHLNRELRFYASIAFDRSKWYDATCENDEAALYNLHFRYKEYSGSRSSENYTITGYLPRKLVNHKSAGTTTEFTHYNYAFPIIRLADLYLMYAEALNETLEAPNGSVYLYVDQIRERAGLKGVVESWADNSIYPTKPTTKNGMRDIIHMERMNELALEGKRFWDMRRWKKEPPQSVFGWNPQGETAEEFYRLTEVFNRPAFYSRDYLWPLKVSTMQRNPNFVQNPGW